MDAGPLVSIGVPTFNRERTLERTLRSALQQTYGRIELVISDNASTDGTGRLCRAVAASDPRVRYLRQATNIGPTENFNTLFRECRGDYVMMLADDDWLDAGYVSACVELLEREPGTALAAGRPGYYRGDEFAGDGALHEHCQPSAGARVLDYLATVDDNGVFYGVMRRGVLDRVQPLPNVLGNDWLHVARVAALGKIRMLDTVHVNRELDGTSASVESILEMFQTHRWQARVPQLVIAWHLLHDIGLDHPAYRGLGRAGRLLVAVAGAAVSIRWRHLAWHVITPSIVAVCRRPRGRPLARLYFRLTRVLGARQRI